MYSFIAGNKDFPEAVFLLSSKTIARPPLQSSLHWHRSYEKKLLSGRYTPYKDIDEKAKKVVEYMYTYAPYKDVKVADKAKKDVEYACTYTPYDDIEVKKEMARKDVEYAYSYTQYDDVEKEYGILYIQGCYMMEESMSSLACF